MLELIRREVNRQALSRAELARRLGWEGRAGWQRVHAILAGQTRATAETLTEMADALGARWVLKIDHRRGPRT